MPEISGISPELVQAKLGQSNVQAGYLIEVCGYTRTRGFTRTRESGTGRVGVSRVGSATGKVITGTGVPGFTRTDV